MQPATGVKLALEPINRYETTLINTASQGLALLDAVETANFGCCWTPST